MLKLLMAAPILTHLDGRIPIARHEHVAVLYRGLPAAFRLASFLAEGLERGDLCLYLSPSTYHAEMLHRLREQVGDLDRFLRTQTLRLHAGLADFPRLQDMTRQVFVEAEEIHAPALRWLEDAAWRKSAGFPQAQFFEFHAILNYQVKHYPSAALCQYDLDQTEPDQLFSVIAVHRHLLVEKTLVRDNPFYIPAEKFIPLNPEERRRDLAQLFREVGFDLEKLLAAITGYGRLGSNHSQNDSPAEE